MAEETNLTVRSMLHDIASRGGTREDIAKNRDAILGAATTTSQGRVRLRYILARIAEEEQVQVAEEEITAHIQEMAGRYRVTPEQLRADIEKRHGLESLRSDIRNEKILARLVEEAKAR